MSHDSEFKPFIPAEKKIPELTAVPLIMGTLFGILFGASSLYLTLKVGMTVSASIPVAVISVTVFRWISKTFGFRKATILENNIVQTAGSAGESLAFGIAATMPALLILGYPMEAGRILIVASLGGLLGILMMIPLRHALIVRDHKKLPFPEGTACAEVLKSGERGGASASMVFGGFFVGLLYKFLNIGTKLWTDTVEKGISWFKGASISAEISPELLGVGYIIGPRIASIMVAGGILSSWVLIPAIILFGEGLSGPLFPGTKLIREMSIHEIWKNYILYIGAGAVAAGGIISLIQNLPIIASSLQAALKGVKKVGSSVSRLRTETDLSLRWVFLGIAALMAGIVFAPQLQMNFMGALLIVVAGFLFVLVSSRLTGEIGSSSNPTSGMTVATLLITSLIFLMFGWTSIEYRVIALSVAAIVCVASSNGGTTAQDLKTGYLVGATPRAQQIAIMVGALSSALVIGLMLVALNDASTIYSKKAVPENTAVIDPSILDRSKTEKVGGSYGEVDAADYFILQVRSAEQSGLSQSLPLGKYLVHPETYAVTYLVDPAINGALKMTDDNVSVQRYDAPKARLMSLIIDGILNRELPWGLVLLGVAITLVMELCGIGSLSFAAGVYLPLAVSAPIFVGGLVRWIVDRLRQRRRKHQDSLVEEETSPGVLFSAGLIAGGSIAGILIAIFSANEKWNQAIDFSSVFPLSASMGFATSMFAVIAGILLLAAGRRDVTGKDAKK